MQNQKQKNRSLAGSTVAGSVVEDTPSTDGSPTQQEIDRAIGQVQKTNPEHYQQIILILYQKLPREGRNQQNTHDVCLSNYCPGERQDSDSDSRQMENRSNDQTVEPPPFQRVEKDQQWIFKATPTKYEVEEEFRQKIKNQQLSINEAVYDRFGGVSTRKQRVSKPKVEKDYKEDNLALIIKAKEWQEQPNREHRLITSKVVPKFKSREEEVRYFEKRLAARAFCERGYGLNQVKEQYSQNGGPVNMEKKRYKTVSTGFISESYRKFQFIFGFEMKKTIRPLTGPQMRCLYSVLLNAQGNFGASEYDCFRKCVKLAYDLGSVSIYEKPAINFYIAVQLHLKERMTSGNQTEFDNDMRSLKMNTSRPLNIYAPMQGGGYQQKLMIKDRLSDYQPEKKVEGQVNLNFDEENVDEDEEGDDQQQSLETVLHCIG